MKRDFNLDLESHTTDPEAVQRIERVLFPRCRRIGAPAGAGRCTLRIRSRREDDGIIITRVFAVLTDGTELEVEDVVGASWKLGEGDNPSTARVDVMGAELDADVEGGEIEFVPGDRFVRDMR